MREIVLASALLALGACSTEGHADPGQVVEPPRSSLPPYQAKNPAQPRGGPGRAGDFVGSGPRKLPAGEPWTLAVSVRRLAVDLPSTLLVADFSTVRAYDLHSGQPRWEQSLRDDRSLEAPAIANGRVLLISDRARVLDLATGAHLWSGNSGIETSPTVARGLLFTMRNGLCSAREAASGEERWSFRPNGDEMLEMFAGEELAYCLTRGSIDALEIATGKPVWRAAVPNLRQAAVDPSRIVWVTQVPNTVEVHLGSLDPRTGAPLWPDEVGIGAATVVSPPTLTAGLLLVIASEGRRHTVIALTPATADEVWRYSTVESGPDPAEVPVGPVAASDGVYFAIGARIFALDAKRGKKRWMHRTPHGHVSDLVIAEGVIYAATRKGVIGLGRPPG